jgi:hypothetical protein
MAPRAKAVATTDHDEIRRWAEERGVRPACVRGTGSDDDIGMIRLDFPGFSGEESLEKISWDDWFQSFDEDGLALLHQEKTPGGQNSNFNKLVAREKVEARQRNRHAARGLRTRSSGTRRRSTGARSQPGKTARRGRNRRQTSSSRSTRADTRRTATSRVLGSKTRASTRRSMATTRGRKGSATAGGSKVGRTVPTRSSSRTSRGVRTTSRRTNVRGSRTNRGNVVAMKKSTRHQRRAA